MSTADGKGYAIPDPIDPESFQCIPVRVPNDTKYLGAFWSAYEFFTTWLAWTRDEAQSGKAAAAVWRVAFDMTREAYDNGEECGMAFSLRQNPANPCQLQQSIDAGETWTLAFDYSLCGGPIASPPPYPDAPAGARDAAGNAITNIYQGLLNLNPDCAMSREEFMTAGTEYLRLYNPDFASPAALGNIYDAFCALDEEGRAEALGECAYKDRFDDVVDCYDAGGVLNDLNCLSEKINNWLNTASDELGLNLDMVAAAMGFIGWQYASSGAGGGGGGVGFGGDFASECGTWEHTFDFTAGDGDLTGSTHFEPGAHTSYVGGTGWQNDSGGVFSLYLILDAGISNVTFMEIDYDSTASAHSPAEKLQIGTQLNIWAGGPDSTWMAGGEHLIHTASHLEAGHVEQYFTFAFVYGEHWSNWPTIPRIESEVTLTRWRLVGTGDNPFI